MSALNAQPVPDLLKQLWGVTRDDLYEMSLRKGNQPGMIPGAAKRPQVIEHAEAVKTPQNEARLLNAVEHLRETRPDMYRAFHNWYAMDPAFKRLVELVGPEDAVRRYTQMNFLSGMESPNMAVSPEIRRGTAANMMWEQGNFDVWKERGGLPQAARGVPELDSVPGRIGGKGIAERQERLIQLVNDGLVTPDLLDLMGHKTGPYSHASGVPETGFQTDLFVGDAHKVRSLGLADTRPASASKDVEASITKSELQSLAPWHRELFERLGIEAVPAQAIEWNLFGPQTGVKTALGAGKLEIMSGEIGKAAKRLGVSPETARDLVLLGRINAGFITPKAAAVLTGLGLLGVGAQSLLSDAVDDAKEKQKARVNRTDDLLKEMER
jgi:hypothetical protein